MIKRYLCLNKDEKNLVCNFENRKCTIKKSLGDIEKDIKSEVYDYGNGSLYYINSDKVLGKALIVLEVADVMKVAYIHSVDIVENIRNEEQVLKELIDKGREIAEEYNAKSVLLGIRDKQILKIASNIGLDSSYSAFNMILKDKDKKCEVLDLVPLCNENRLEYIEVYNKSFMDMPHGTYIDIEDSNEYLKKTDKNNKYFMVVVGNFKIGVVNITINENEGFFDIGLCKEYRGKEYGKRLLETAIELLKENNVEKICLTVIEKNKIAFDMYKKRGFKTLTVLSRWIELV